jgi:hypothetical protein
LSSLFYNVKKISWINWKIKYWLLRIIGHHILVLVCKGG